MLFANDDLGLVFKPDGCKIIKQPAKSSCLINSPHEILSKKLGNISPDETIQYWSWGRFGMCDLMFYILKQTGPADILISSWSICETAIRKIVLKHNEGLIKNISFLLDPRIKVRNPVPLQMIMKNFTYKLSPCHAKVTLIENDKWNISIVSSMNMTQNPRIERGVIFTDRQTFEFDKKIITNEIYGRTN